MAQAARLAAVKESYYPAREWVEPDNETLTNLSWEAYVRACHVNNIEPERKSDALLATSRNTYSQVVIAELQSTFVADELRRNGLVDYLNRKTAFFDTNGDVR